MTLKIGKIQPQSTKLSAIERLKIDFATISRLLLIWSIFVCIEDMHDIYLRGSVKITEPYPMTFKFGIVDNKCDYFL